MISNEKALISAFEMLAVCVTLDVGIHKMVITKVRSSSSVSCDFLLIYVE
jgi:hypothetical protein